MATTEGPEGHTMGLQAVHAITVQEVVIQKLVTQDPVGLHLETPLLRTESLVGPPGQADEVVAVDHVVGDFGK